MSSSCVHGELPVCRITRVYPFPWNDTKIIPSLFLPFLCSHHPLTGSLSKIKVKFERVNPFPREPHRITLSLFFVPSSYTVRITRVRQTKTLSSNEASLFYPPFLHTHFPSNLFSAIKYLPCNEYANIIIYAQFKRFPHVLSSCSHVCYTYICLRLSSSRHKVKDPIPRTLIIVTRLLVHPYKFTFNQRATLRCIFSYLDIRRFSQSERHGTKDYADFLSGHRELTFGVNYLSRVWLRQKRKRPNEDEGQKQSRESRRSEQHQRTTTTSLSFPHEILNPRIETSV